MQPISATEMAELRRIAERHWDALAALNRATADSGRYDRFLASAAVMVRSGASDVEVGDYFVDVATESLGVDTGGGIRERAQLLAGAIREHLAAAPEALS